MNILIILGHPLKDSLCGALAQSYKKGVVDAGVQVREMALADLRFDPDVRQVSPRDQAHEEDILRAKEWIAWADHIVFVYPTWWGTMPALLKGFLDRVFTPGFAFEEIEGGVTGYGKLLRGKSAAIITTMDTPILINKWVNKSPGNNALKKATLQFCGVNPVKVTNFSPLKKADVKKRQRWLEKVRQQGLSLKQGRISNW